MPGERASIVRIGSVAVDARGRWCVEGWTWDARGLPIPAVSQDEAGPVVFGWPVRDLLEVAKDHALLSAGAVSVELVLSGGPS